MTGAESEAAFAELQSVLADERAALRAGALDALATLAARKAAAIAAVATPAGAIPADRLAGLLRQAEDNARLLAACRAGLNSAQDRLRAISRAARGCGAYDRDGSLRILGAARDGLDRRA